MREVFEKYIHNLLIDKIAIFLFGILIIWVIIKVIQKFLFLNIKDRRIRYKAKKIIVFLGYFLSAILVIVIYSNKMKEFTVALGVAGAGIAFALQEVIASFAGWLAILFGGFYKTGDRVQLGGIKGDVMDIGVLRTTIMEIGQWVEADLYNGRVVYVANSFVFKEPVFNYSGNFPFLWDEIKITIQFGSNYEKAKEMFLNIADEVTKDYIVNSKEPWEALTKKFFLEETQKEAMVSIIANDSGVVYILRYLVNYKKRRITR